MFVIIVGSSTVIYIVPTTSLTTPLHWLGWDAVSVISIGLLFAWRSPAPGLYLTRVVEEFEVSNVPSPVEAQVRLLKWLPGLKVALRVTWFSLLQILWSVPKSIEFNFWIILIVFVIVNDSHIASPVSVPIRRTWPLSFTSDWYVGWFVFEFRTLPPPPNFCQEIVL